MHLSTTNTILKFDYRGAPLIAFDQCFSALAQAGYDHVDIDFWDLSAPNTWFDADGWEETVCRIGELTRQYRLPVYQTHGNTYLGMQWDDPQYPQHEFNLRTTLRSIRAAAMIGAKHIVLHPMNLPHDPLYSPSKAKEACLRYLDPYINEAKKQGICIAVENMVDFRGFRRRYCGGDIGELIDLVDTVNDPSVGICLDTGHAHMSGIDPTAAIRAIGSRLKATHINDNHANGADEHLFPYFGTICWNGVSTALREIGYEGDFSYEAGSQGIPAPLYPSWLSYTVALGRQLMSE